MTIEVAPFIIHMEIKYDSSQYDAVVARSKEDAVRKFRKQMDKEGTPYSGIVATEKKEIEGTNRTNAYIMKAITIDSLSEESKTEARDLTDKGEVQQDQESTKVEVQQCPECDASLVASADRKELVCKDCGLVIGEGTIDPGPEWRNFNKDEKE